MGNVVGDFFEILLCAYGVTKYMLKRTSICSNKNLNTLFEILYIVIALTICALYAIISIPLLIFQQIANLYLQRKHGARFAGLFNAMDTMWILDGEQARHIIHGFYVLELEKTIKPEEVLKVFRNRMRNSQKIQFNSTVHCFVNIWYRLKSDDILDKVLKVIDFNEGERKYKDKFEEKMSEMGNTPLPKNVLFEIFISSNSIEFFDTKPNTSNHILIVRFHHSLGDGLNIFQYFLENLVDQEIKTPMEETRNTNVDIPVKNAQKSQLKFTKIIKNILGNINKIPDFMNKDLVYRFSPAEPEDDNILHGPKLDGEKILIFHSEQEPRYVPNIRKFRKRFDSCTFSNVLYAALSASLWEYYQKHDQSNIPKNVHIVFITISPKAEDVREKDNMHSTFSTSAIDIPIKLDDCSEQPIENLIARLKIIMARNKIVRKSIDPLVFYWCSNLVYFFPTWFSRALFKSALRETVSISNLSDITPMSFNGQKVNEIIFWTPNVSKVGVGLALFAYKNRLRIGLITDKAVTPSRAHALDILNNFCKYLDLLGEEINTDV